MRSRALLKCFGERRAQTKRVWQDNSCVSPPHRRGTPADRVPGTVSSAGDLSFPRITPDQRQVRRGALSRPADIKALGGHQRHAPPPPPPGGAAGTPFSQSSRRTAADLLPALGKDHSCELLNHRSRASPWTKESASARRDCIVLAGVRGSLECRSPSVSACVLWSAPGGPRNRARPDQERRQRTSEPQTLG